MGGERQCRAIDAYELSLDYILLDMDGCEYNFSVGFSTVWTKHAGMLQLLPILNSGGRSFCYGG